MDDNESEAHNRMKAALVFAVKMLWQVQQYTSKHCTDCMMNRYRTECGLSYIQSLCKEIEVLDPDADTKTNIKCREIEEKSWEHQKNKCA